MSFYWYDFETFGIDPLRDRPCQFAGVRTDENFNEIEAPLVIYCKPSDDVLPHPDACLITGITPQKAAQHGVVEAEFIRQIEQEFARPGTCVVGYNSIRFDDEVTRHCLYRNFYDPYAREWQHGNSRWDIIDMVRLVRATRPDGINWPNHANGNPSFKLEDLTKANGITHDAAHDALSDVRATIAIAKLIKQKQPKLFDFVFNNRDKKSARKYLDVCSYKPVLHISSKYSAEKGCAALVVPIAQDQINSNAVYVYDLSVDPQPLIDLNVEQLKARIFTASIDLPDGVSRVPLKAVHTNKCPVLVPPNTIKGAVAKNLGIDFQTCVNNLNKIKLIPNLEMKIQAVFKHDYPKATNPDLMLYAGGFFSSNDKKLMTKLRELSSNALADISINADDDRITEMLFRYRARNYPDTLSSTEQITWHKFCYECLEVPDAEGVTKLDAYSQRINQLRQSGDMNADQELILDQLETYANDLLNRLK